MFVVAIRSDIERGIDVIGSVQFDTGSCIDDASREDIAVETSWFLCEGHELTLGRAALDSN